MKVKICGITNLEDAIICEEAGTDALGFIFYKNSKRFLEPGKAGKIISELSPFTIKVGVFVNSSSEEINRIANKIKLNVVQLHGDETPGMVSEINLPVIKSFRIKNGFNFSELTKYKNVKYLFDTYSEKEYGGTGKTFDWKIIPSELKTKIILSGGVSIENIEDVYKNVKPAAVDLSSSLETKPGKKDKEKVREFFNKINHLRS